MHLYTECWTKDLGDLWLWDMWYRYKVNDGWRSSAPSTDLLHKGRSTRWTPVALLMMVSRACPKILLSLKSKLIWFFLFWVSLASQAHSQSARHKWTDIAPMQDTSLDACKRPSHLKSRAPDISSKCSRTQGLALWWRGSAFRDFSEMVSQIKVTANRGRTVTVANSN